MIEFFVAGIPVPKGSTKSFYNPKAKRIVTLNANDNTRGWQSLISMSAKKAGARMNESDPIRLRMTFFMPRPKGHFGKRGLRSSAQPYPISRKADLDKLCRGILDALTGIAYLDDAQVIGIQGLKVYAETGQPGAEVVIYGPGEI